jgi:hypothetical protein
MIMATSTETGHSKNVANFEDLISFCNGYGVSYNPSNVNLTIAKLTSLQTQAKDNLQKTKITKTTYDNAVNAKKLAFKDLKSLSTKILSAFTVSGASKLAIEDVKAMNRKIQGIRATPVVKTVGTFNNPVTTVTKEKTVSSAQQSYDSLIDHFSKMIEIISQESNYKPNEVELKVTTLQAKLDTLKTTNSEQINSNTEWSNVRIERNTILYNPETGLVQTALDVKMYVKSVFGTKSPQYKQVSKLKFTNFK